MASLRFDGIRFAAYSNDHPPRHVHGILAETEVIVDLREDGTVSLAERTDCLRPTKAKRSMARHILKVAGENFELLAAPWESVHGNAA